MVKGYIYKFTNKRTNQSYIGKTFISSCCHGKYKTAGNYKWKLKED